MHARSSRTRRVALLGLSHETNTFATSRVTPAVLRDAPLLVGSAIAAAHVGERSSVSGFLSAADDDTEIVPLIYAFVTPMGLVSEEAFEWFSGEMIRQLRKHGPWDALFLALHGAGVSENASDMDGELIFRTRAELGSTTPIGVALDMHANVSQMMIDHSTITTLYRTNPHLDAHAQARRCATLTLRTAEGAIRPVQVLRQIPLLANILTHGSEAEPLASLLREFEQAEEADGTLYAGLALGYPYADVPEVGMSALVIDDGDRLRASSTCSALAKAVWSARDLFQQDAFSVEEAVRTARATNERPVVLLDVGDNVGGGAHGDSTLINRELCRAGVSNVLSVLTDHESVCQVSEIGIGEVVALKVGGKSHPGIGDPLTVSGRIRARSDGKFTLDDHVHAGIPSLSVGELIIVDSEEYGTLIITSEPFMPFSVTPFADLAIDVTSYDAIIAKGVIAPRAGFASSAGTFITVATPGPTVADVRELPYLNRATPLYPLEPNCSYSPRPASDDHVRDVSRHPSLGEQVL